jgi:hypothetical protein
MRELKKTIRWQDLVILQLRARRTVSASATDRGNKYLGGFKRLSAFPAPHREIRTAKLRQPIRFGPTFDRAPNLVNQACTGMSLDSRRLSCENYVRTKLEESRMKFLNNLVTAAPASNSANQFPVGGPQFSEHRGVSPNERGIPILTHRADRHRSIAWWRRGHSKPSVRLASW